MKKLILSAALLLAFAANAQTETTTPPTTTPAATEVTATPNQDQEKEYKKISQSQIAPDVLKQAIAKYKDYSLVEALATADGSEYKLVLTKDGKDVAAFFKSNGEFIKEETV